MQTLAYICRFVDLWPSKKLYYQSCWGLFWSPSRTTLFGFSTLYPKKFISYSLVSLFFCTTYFLYLVISIFLSVSVFFLFCILWVLYLYYPYFVFAIVSCLFLLFFVFSCKFWIYYWILYLYCKKKILWRRKKILYFVYTV